MKDPCKKCLVKACCSQPCLDYATYVYETKEYYYTGKKVRDKIDKMEKSKAIDFILQAERLSFYISNVGK